MRTFNDDNLHKFNENLSNAKWSSFRNMEDPNEAYNDFIEEYSRIYNTCFPLKVLKGKQVNKFFSPWLSPGLLKSVNKKNRLHKKFVSSPSASSETKYQAYKNKLTHLIRIAKRKYYDSKFENARNDLKTTWKLLNEVINKRKSKSSLPTSFKSEGRTLTDPMEIADRFCKYFTNIGPNLAKSIPKVNPSFRSYLGDNIRSSINLKPTTTSELESICDMFASKKAPGYDSIPMHVIKYSFHLISAPLADIINLSLLKGIFPDKLKIAKIIPIFKAEDPNFFVNYRPISLLSNFSKFFEKVMYNRLVEFAEKHDILYRCQFGFRKNHSTSHALIHLVNKIASAIDQHETTVGVFLDLSKAFDTLDHQILFARLELYGIRDVALQWFKSYFSCRQQFKFVQFNQACSPKQIIKCGGVPYINDLPNASELTDPLLFANDTSIFNSHSNPNSLESVLSDKLQNVNVRLKRNRLLVNKKNTSYVIFKLRQKKVNSNIPLSFGGKPLKRSKFLGVYIDDHLTWKHNLGYVCKQIVKSIGIIFRSRFFPSSTTKLTLYDTLIYPHIVYCNSAWVVHIRIELK